MASITEEKLSPDVDRTFTKEKLSMSPESGKDNIEIKSDTVLDEIAAKVDALDFHKKSDGEDDDEFFITETETEIQTINRQSEIIKKQAETINTLIQQLRVMFDEYNAACQEKEYYEDLSEALFRYIEICEGNIVIEEEICTQIGDDENISNLITKDQEKATVTEADDADGATAPNPTPDRVEKQAEPTTTDQDQSAESMAVDDSETTAPPPNNVFLTTS